MTPLKALAPQAAPPGPRTTSMRSMSSRMSGRRKYSPAPNAGFSPMRPSCSSRVRSENWSCRPRTPTSERLRSENSTSTPGTNCRTSAMEVRPPKWMSSAVTTLTGTDDCRMGVSRREDEVTVTSTCRRSSSERSAKSSSGGTESAFAKTVPAVLRSRANANGVVFFMELPRTSSAGLLTDVNDPSLPFYRRNLRGARALIPGFWPARRYGNATGGRRPQTRPQSRVAGTEGARVCLITGRVGESPAALRRTARRGSHQKSPRGHD